MKDQILDYSPPQSLIADKRFLAWFIFFIGCTVLYIILTGVEIFLDYSALIGRGTISILSYVRDGLYVVAIYSVAYILKRYRESNILIVSIYLFCLLYSIEIILLVILQIKFLPSLFLTLPAFIIKLVVISKSFSVSHREISKYFKLIGISLILVFFIRLSVTVLTLNFQAEDFSFILKVVPFIFSCAILILQLKVYSLLSATPKNS